MNKTIKALLDEYVNVGLFPVYNYTPRNMSIISKMLNPKILEEYKYETNFRRSFLRGLYFKKLENVCNSSEYRGLREDETYYVNFKLPDIYATNHSNVKRIHNSESTIQVDYVQLTTLTRKDIEKQSGLEKHYSFTNSGFVLTGADIVFNIGDKASDRDKFNWIAYAIEINIPIPYENEINMTRDDMIRVLTLNNTYYQENVLEELHNDELIKLIKWNLLNLTAKQIFDKIYDHLDSQGLAYDV